MWKFKLNKLTLFRRENLMLNCVRLLCDPMDCSPPGSSVHRDSPGNLLDPGIELMSPALAGRFFTTDLPGKFKS